MEIEATEKFYVNGKDSPAFLYFPRGHYLSIDHKHTLYMSRVGLIATFGTRKKTLERLKEIIESANFPTRVYQVSKYGKKRGKRILFAENKVQHTHVITDPLTRKTKWEISYHIISQQHQMMYVDYQQSRRKSIITICSNPKCKRLIKKSLCY